MMFKIEAIIRPEILEEAKAALHEIHVNGVTVSEVMGFGAQRGYQKMIRAQALDTMMQPKIKLEIVVSAVTWKDKVIKTIMDLARSGACGDGKIFVYEIQEAYKIRTGETGYAAIQSEAAV